MSYKVVGSAQLDVDLCRIMSVVFPQSLLETDTGREQT